jgi:hypothetical protein
VPIRQPLLNRAPPQRLSTGAIAAAPTDGTTLPHRQMSAVTPTGMTTTGLAIGLEAPTVGAATAIAGGFTVTIWLLNPVTLAWFSSSSAAIGFGEAFCTFDFNASGIYYQVAAASVAAAGLIDFHVWEQ